MRSPLTVVFLLLAVTLASNAAEVRWKSTQYLLDHDSLQSRPGSRPLPALTHKFPNGDQEQITSVVGIAILTDGPVAAVAQCKRPGATTILEFDGTEWLAIAWKGPYKAAADENYLEYSGGGVHVKAYDEDIRIIAGSKRCAPGNIFPALQAGERFAMLGGPKSILRTPSNILSVASDGRTKGAVGTQTGLYLLETGKESELAEPEIDGKSLALKNVGAVFYDASDRLWVGCDQGVLIFDGSSWKLDEPAAAFSSSTFTCAAAEPDGQMWFGTDKGAYRREEAHWRQFSGPQWLPSDHIKDVAVQTNGTVWLATTTGIASLTPKP